MSEGFWIELNLSLHQTDENGSVQQIGLTKTERLATVPHQGQFICLDTDNDNWARVTEVVLQPLGPGCNCLDSAAAWVYCELKKGDPSWKNNDITAETLETEYGWSY